MEVKAPFRFRDTTATKKIFALTKRIRAVKGGTSASKTISILVWCIDYAQTTRDELISIVSVTFPHLEDGAMRDFKAIMKDRGYWDDEKWHDTKHEYTFETGTVIEFLSVDSYGKAHGPRRDVLFVNEANNFAWNIVDQLITRTRKIVWLDWNPVTEFWFDTEVNGRRNDVDFITLTYLDNEALDDTTRAEIESHKHNRQWWQVYGLGQLGEVEGRIYTGWQIIDEIPHEARLERYGLDFGYSNDPAALVGVYYYNGGYILDEVLYRKGMLNKPLADFILSQPQAIVVADSAEPKSIDELVLYGLAVIPAEKGSDSVRHGINIVQAQRISVTRRSFNLLKEYNAYLWAVDRNGRTLQPNEPEGGFDHALDALRYALVSIAKTASPAIRQQQEAQFMRNESRQHLNSGR